MPDAPYDLDLRSEPSRPGGRNLRVGLGRSAFLGVLAAALLAAGPSCPQVSPDRPVCRRAAPLGAFLDSIAINTHLQQGWQYADAAKTVATLKQLGIVQVRDAFAGLGQPQIEFAAAQGIRFLFIVSGGWGDNAVPSLEAWERRYPGSILAIEGPNEVNNWPVTYRGQTGVPAAKAFQDALYRGVHASAVLRHIPVVALTSWPVFHNESDIGNIHAYSRSGDYATFEIGKALQDEKTNNPPAKPTWLTEVGYHTHLGRDHDEGVSEAIQARMILSLYLGAWSLGIGKTFLYQLANQYTDPNDEQSYFGLVDQQWRPKPAFTVLRTMLEILGVDRTAGSAPRRSLSYAIDDLPPTAHHALFSTPGGDWLVAIWNEPKVWDIDADRELPLNASKVTLRLGRSYPNLSLFDPLVGRAPMRIVGDADRLALDLTDHPIFVKIGRDHAKTASQDACADTNL